MTEQKIYIDQPLILELEVYASTSADNIADEALSADLTSPSGTVTNFSATLKAGSTKIILCPIPGNTLSIAGAWRVQSKLTSGTDIWPGATNEFVVYAPGN